MKKIFALLLILAVTFTISVNSEPSNPVKGKVVSLSKVVLGGDGSVTKSEAKELADKGEPIVLLSGKTIYFVFNEDGTFAGKTLAKYAANDNVGVVGKVKKVKGVNVIVATMIESMD